MEKATVQMKNRCISRNHRHMWNKVIEVKKSGLDKKEYWRKLCFEMGDNEAEKSNRKRT